MVFAFLGPTTVIIILVIVLLVFGPEKLPEIGKQIGTAMREFNKVRDDVQRALDISSYTNLDSSHYDASPYGTYPTTGSTAALDSYHDAPHDPDYGMGHPADHHDPYHGTVAGVDEGNHIVHHENGDPTTHSDFAASTVISLPHPPGPPTAQVANIISNGGANGAAKTYNSSDEVPQVTPQPVSTHATETVSVAS